MLFTDLIDIQHAYIILCNRHDDPHQEQDAEVDEDGVGGQKKMLCLELNTFDPTYFDFIEIASKMSKWEPKYHNGVSRTLKVTAPFGDTLKQQNWTTFWKFSPGVVIGLS